MFSQTVKISFEIFPPNTIEGIKQLATRCQGLNEFQPDYFSVTFGASGVNQEKTQATVKELIKYRLKVAPHISCVAMTKKRILNLLSTYKQLGISKLIVIRGDPLQSNLAVVSDFHYANELVTYIRAVTGDYFHITVAAYPEFHPESPSPDIDLNYFKCKVECGANSATTQFFLNSDAYFRFIEACFEKQIYIPIIPGIMLIQDYNKLLKFSSSCGAEIPLWIKKYLANKDQNEKVLEKLGIEIITKLCIRLILEGAKHLHFYTLNKTELVAHIIKNIQNFIGE